MQITVGIYMGAIQTKIYATTDAGITWEENIERGGNQRFYQYLLHKMELVGQLVFMD